MRFFCWLGLSFGAAGGGYFLTLVLGWPFTVAVLIAALATIALGWWLLRHADAAPKSLGVYTAALLAGVSLLLYRSLALLEKHGGWDAWAMWNYHARMLTDPQRWSNLFQPMAFDHPDYPLCLPAGLAFLLRAAPDVAWDSPSVVAAFAGMLAVAMLLFSVLFRRQVWVGIAALFLLTQDDVFLRIAASQYADTLTAFYLLIAVVALDYSDTDWRAAIVAGAAVGLCVWTKNEGLILALLTGVCYASRLFRKGIGARFLLGLLVPLAWWAIFKFGYAPPNDLLGQSTASLTNAMATPMRFSKVWEEVSLIVCEQYAVLAWLVVLCGGFLVARKEAPSRALVLSLLAFLAYYCIFLVSPYEPEWHVRTAMPRLIHQLHPLLLYACGMLLAKYRFLPAEKLPR